MSSSCINLSSKALIEEHLRNYARYVVWEMCCAAMLCFCFELHVLLNHVPGAVLAGADAREEETYNSSPK